MKKINIFTPYKLKVSSYYDPSAVKISELYTTEIARFMQQLFNLYNKNLDEWIKVLQQRSFAILSFSISNNYYVIVVNSNDQNTDLQNIANKKHISNIQSILNLSSLLTSYATMLKQKNKKPSIKGLHDIIKQNVKPINTTCNSIENSAEQQNIKEQLFYNFTRLIIKDDDLNEDTVEWQKSFKEILDNVSLVENNKQSSVTSNFIKLIFPFLSSIKGSRADYAASNAVYVMKKLKINSLNNSLIIKIKNNMTSMNTLYVDEKKAKLNYYVNKINNEN